MQDRRPPLRLIRTTRTTPTPEPETGTVTPARPDTGSEDKAQAPARERVAGRRLIGFLSSFADSIDNDIKNIMDL